MYELDLKLVANFFQFIVLNSRLRIEKSGYLHQNCLNWLFFLVSHLQMKSLAQHLVCGHITFEHGFRSPRAPDNFIFVVALIDTSKGTETSIVIL